MDRYVDYVPLEQVRLATRNPKSHDTAGIANSIHHHGFAELPLLDERTGRLVAGHGRITTLRARVAAGDTAPDGVRVDDDGHWLVPVIRGWASRADADAEAYGTASNRLTELGGWNDRELAAVLRDLAADDLLAVSGYTTTDLDVLLRTTDMLGDDATAFLDTVINPPATTTPTGHGGGTEPPRQTPLPGITETSDDYTTVSWLVTVDDRATVRTALTAVQRHQNLDTSASALVALARYYLDREASVTT